MKKIDTSAVQKYFTEETIGLVNRTSELKQLKYAILTKEHMLLTGRAGTGKSQFAMRAFEHITGSKLFSIHLTKQTTEEYVFGPLDINEFKKGKIKHNIEDGILTADFAFIDEFFDASDVLLRSLLGVLNERVWMKAGHVKAPLHTAVLTSNYTRESEVTDAVLDRIIFKADITPLNDHIQRVKAYNNYLLDGTQVKYPTLSLTELQEMASIIEDPNSIKFPNDVLEVYDQLADEFQNEFKPSGKTNTEGRKYLSQRTLHKALKVAKASALLRDNSTVDFDDLEEMKYVFCTLNNREEEAVFDAVFDKIVAPAKENVQIQTTLKNFSQQLGSFATDPSKIDDESELIEMCRSLTALTESVQELRNRTKDSRLQKQASTIISDAELLARKSSIRLKDLVKSN
jgi:MoxR-like ATPase